MLLAARLALAAVLLLAAAAKLLDRDASRASLASHGVPRRLALGVPVVELVLAGLLVPAATAVAGAVATGAFLVVASAMLARSGEDCGCFGAAAAVRPRTALARNAALAGVAVIVALTDAPAMTTAAAVACGVLAVLAVQVVAGWQLLAQNGRLLARVEALEQPLPSTPAPGAPAPNFVLPDGDGEPTTLADLLEPDGLVLVFTDPGCATCADLPERLSEIQRDSGRAIAIVTRGEAGAFAPTLIQEEHEVARLYGAGQMPSALEISADGRVASSLALGLEAIERLIRPVHLEVIR